MVMIFCSFARCPRRPGIQMNFLICWSYFLSFLQLPIFISIIPSQIFSRIFLNKKYFALHSKFHGWSNHFIALNDFCSLFLALFIGTSVSRFLQLAKDIKFFTKISIFMCDELALALLRIKNLPPSNLVSKELNHFGAQSRKNDAFPPKWFNSLDTNSILLPSPLRQNYPKILTKLIPF